MNVVNPEMKKIQAATAADKLGKGFHQAPELHTQFFALFEPFRPALLDLDMASELTQQGDRPPRLRVITPFDNLFANAAFAFDDGHASAAMLFTDEKKVDDRTVSRKLNAVVMDWEGYWIDSDGTG